MNKLLSNTTISYEKDFYQWALNNSRLLKEGKLTEIDAENIAEELESMGKRDKRQVINRLIVLLTHLLKWEFQPEKRSGSWKGTIMEQRRRILQLLEDSPSLNNEIDKKLNYAYQEAVKQASVEMNSDPLLFPEQCPYQKEYILSDELYSGGIK
jgi:hypothetical protein